MFFFCKFDLYSSAVRFHIEYWRPSSTRKRRLSGPSFFIIKQVQVASRKKGQILVCGIKKRDWSPRLQKNKAAYLHVGRNSKNPVFVEKFCGDHTATESILLPSCGRPCQVGKWCASLPSYLLSLSRTLAGYPHLKYNRSRAGGNDRCLDVFTALFSWWFNIRSLRITEFHRNDNLAMISDHDSDSGCLSFTSSFWPKRRKVK